MAMYRQSDRTEIIKKVLCKKKNYTYLEKKKKYSSNALRNTEIQFIEK